MPISNPATLLAAQFEKWTVPANVAPENRRGLSGYENPIERDEAWDDHQRAFEWLSQIAELLDGMSLIAELQEQAAFYRDYLPSWQDAVVSLPNPWNSGVPHDRPAVADESSLQILKAFGHLLDSQALTPQPSETELDELRAAFAEVLAAISAANIDQPTRRYIFGLAQHCSNVLDELQAFGSVTLRARANELTAALTVVAVTQTSLRHEQRTRFARLAGVIGRIAGTVLITKGAELTWDAASDYARDWFTDLVGGQRQLPPGSDPGPGDTKALQSSAADFDEPDAEHPDIGLQKGGNESDSNDGQ